MKTVEYLAACKRVLGVSSDYALAARLGITRSAVSKYGSGQSTLGKETAMRVAQVLGVPPALVLADMMAERESNPVVASVWSDLAARLAADFRPAPAGRPARRRPALAIAAGAR